MECGGTPEISRGQLNIEESRKASRKLCMTHQNNPIDVPRYFLYWPSRSCLTSPGVWLQLSDVVSFRGFQCENINVKTASQISRLTVTSPGAEECEKRWDLQETAAARVSTRERQGRPRQDLTSTHQWFTGFVLTTKMDIE